MAAETPVCCITSHQVESFDAFQFFKSTRGRELGFLLNSEPETQSCGSQMQRGYFSER
jgi:hypothetical protein